MAFFEVNELYFRYNSQWILENITFKGKKGELLAIVGPSGCGKTTLLKILVGALNPQKGAAFLDNANIIEKPIENRNIGYVPQNQSLFPHLTVFDNIAFGLNARKWSANKIHSRVNELAKMGGMEKMLKRRPHELSGGQQQRVALMRALAPSPQLLLLDEPLSNVDAHLREQLAIYIRNIQQMSCITTLFVTHDLNEAKMLADKLIVLDKGKIVQYGSPTKVVLHPESVEAARTLGVKNLYEIISVTQDNVKQQIIVTTEIGNFHIPFHSNNDTWRRARGIYIDPTSIAILSEQIDAVNILFGEILANIPEPMIHQSTLLVKISKQNNELRKSPTDPTRDQIHILRVQIPINKALYQIHDQVVLKINPNLIQMYQ